MGFFDHFKKKSTEITPGLYGWFNEGMEKYARKDYHGAATNFGVCIEMMPSNAHFYALRANCHEDTGNDLWAEKDFLKSIELDPKSFTAAYRLGMLYSRKKDLPTAVKYLKQSFANAPDLVDMKTLGLGKNNALFVGKQVIGGNLSNLLMQNKQLDEAMHYVELTIKLAPDYPNVYMAKGLTLTQMGKLAEAKTAFQRALSLGMTQAQQGLDMLSQMAIEEEYSQGNNDLKERFKSDIASNIQNIIDTKGYGAISIHTLEQEVIYYACDILDLL